MKCIKILKPQAECEADGKENIVGLPLTVPGVPGGQSVILQRWTECL